MCSIRDLDVKIDVIKADLEEFQSKIDDPAYTETQRRAFADLAGHRRRALDKTRLKRYQKRKAIEKELAKQQQLEA